MNEIETMVQRFVDQELSPDERVRFVIRLGRDAALRDRVLALEEVVADTSRLPRPLVPDRFVREVMRRSTAGAARSAPAPVPSQAPGTASQLWRRVVDLLWTPRSLRWNLAGAAALGVAVTAAVFAILSQSPTRTESASAGPASMSGSALASSTSTSASAPVILVRLIVLQPGATSVAVAGDFNAWTAARTPLERVGGDAWAATIPLEPGRYEYMLVVDGHQWMTDPLASEYSNDGFGSRNAVLDVRPPVDPL